MLNHEIYVRFFEEVEDTDEPGIKRKRVELVGEQHQERGLKMTRVFRTLSNI